MLALFIQVSYFLMYEFISNFNLIELIPNLMLEESLELVVYCYFVRVTHWNLERNEHINIINFAMFKYFIKKILILSSLSESLNLAEDHFKPSVIILFWNHMHVFISHHIDSHQSVAYSFIFTTNAIGRNVQKLKEGPIVS